VQEREHQVLGAEPAVTSTAGLLGGGSQDRLRGVEDELPVLPCSGPAYLAWTAWRETPMSPPDLSP
jgi:hypothetical protein